MTCLLHNGTLVEEELCKFSVHNRSFLYGDGFFETIRVYDGRLPFWGYHHLRIKSTASFLQIQLPDSFSSSYVEEMLLSLVAMHKGKQGRIRLHIYRREGGRYTPEYEEAEWIAVFETIEAESFSHPRLPLKTDIFSVILKPCHELSRLKTANALLYVLAAKHAKDHFFDDCLLLNTHGHPIEATSSNLFIVANHTLFTPPLSEGPLEGILRRFILDHADMIGITVIEKPLTIDEVLQSDEIILTNSIQGARQAILAFSHNTTDYTSVINRYLDNFCQTNQA